MSDSLTPLEGVSAESGLGSGSCGYSKHTYLFVDTGLLLLDLLFQPSQAGSIWCGTIGLEYLYVPGNRRKHSSSRRRSSTPVEGLSVLYILIGEGCDLLLGLFIICKLLLVLLPTLPSCTRHLGNRGALFVCR